tara:strand:- start:1587 stop:2033 length:447 start_codon:yes stop_codon:yes gene_type:complete
MRLFDRFKKKNTNERIPAKGQVDFDSLVERARSGDPEQLTYLYAAFLNLDNWTYLASGNDPEKPKPYIGEVDGQPWIFIFTDSIKASEFDQNPDGRTKVIKMDVDSSLHLIYKLNERGVYGIRVNEGENGWFCSIAELPNIIGYIKNK